MTRFVPGSRFRIRRSGTGYAGLSLAALLAACATDGSDSRPVSPSPVVSESGVAPAPGVLADARVPSGSCGTILWVRAGADQVPVFRSIDDGTALMVIDGQPVPLTLTGRGGESRAGIPATQAFTGEAGRGTVEVTMRGVWGRPFPAGSYMSRATITVTGADGWSRVLPAAGIAGCRP